MKSRRNKYTRIHNLQSRRIIVLDNGMFTESCSQKKFILILFAYYPTL